MRAHTYTRTLICGEPLARVDSYSLTLKKRRQAGRQRRTQNYCGHHPPVMPSSVISFPVITNPEYPRQFPGTLGTRGATLQMLEKFLIFPGYS